MKFNSNHGYQAWFLENNFSLFVTQSYQIASKHMEYYM